MLRIAVPNKGALSEPASAMLHEAGYRQRKDRRELVLVDGQNQVEFFFLRPRDIATYVGSGRLDIGITGRDLLLDSGAGAEEILQLGFGSSTFRYATRPDTVTDVSRFGGLTIATSFPGLVEKHLAEHGVQAAVVQLEGAVETAIQLGVAQVIADVVETGTTLRQAGLEIIGEPILQSEAVVIRQIGAEAEDPKVRQFLRRMQGVLVARRYVMMDYDIRAEKVEQAVALTPGLESPTISPLHHEGWVAVRSMVPTGEAQRIMDDLYDLGARAILTTGIHACRL
ncbi:ATP phosphoribosyltransferase [Streptomyces sp. SL13]|uniref:ATP phosphoribosyltransferase n=1 Tax=Streptantibioticus silvisoli TaxID=2705255 RepID=A0AA90HAW0_9ACTN|nr:ATP phosphoribosyltransferase [Streptantibioticus silvisoli]MDI5964740.1 ATP phosphoribosyltransferase [Streptantibioticus silvisoli]MDI5972215.1 ATP phosphoribosyltransferase [Streptantibioticus silvisoli]